MKTSSCILIAAILCSICIQACQKKDDTSNISNSKQTSSSKIDTAQIIPSIIPNDERKNLTDALMKEIVNCQTDNVPSQDNDENIPHCDENAVIKLVHKGASLDNLAKVDENKKSQIDINQPIYEKDGLTPGVYMYWAGEYDYTENQHRGRVWNFIKDARDESLFLAQNHISDDYRLLKYALQNADREMTNKLLASGLDINQKYKDGTTPIFYAEPNNASSDKTYALKLLIEKGADIHVKDNLGNTLLHQGFSGELNKILINAKLDVNAQNKLGQTPLISACIKNGDINELLNANADVNLKTNEGESVLGCMMKKGPENTEYQDIVKLIDAGADLTFLKIPDDSGTTQLDAYKKLVIEQYDKMDDISPTELGHTAYHRYAKLLESDAECFNADTPRADRMLKHALSRDYDFNPADDNRNENSMQALQTAVQNGADLNHAYKNGTYPIFLVKDVESAQILKDAGADFKAKAKDGSSALHRPLSKSLIEFMLKAGTDPKTVDQFGNTPLFYLDTHNTDAKDIEAIVQMLLNAGTDAKIINAKGQNALFGIDDIKIVRQLIRAGADASIVDQNNENTLFHAADAEVIQELLKGKANPKLINKDGETALFHPMQPQSASLLIRHGTDVNAVTQKGVTALFNAENKDVISILIKAGIDINHQNNQGKTALFGASPEKQKSLIENGINVNIQDNTGKTAAFYVRLENTIEMEKGRWYEPNLSALEELVNAGANLNIIDQNGDNIYQLCRQNCRNPDTADKLRELMSSH